MSVSLSICYPVYRDFDGLYFSAMDLPLSHPEIIDRIEVIVIDSDPDPRGAYAKATNNWVATHLASSARARYVSAPEPRGPAPAKQRCFDEASGSHVLVMDSHVRVAPGSLARLLRFLDANPDSPDLYSGPMIYDSDALHFGRGDPLVRYTTHLDEVWRGQMLGTWATDPRGAEMDGEPFEVPAMGCGLFVSRKDAFVGFHPEFRGFGGEEYYLHEKTRQAGRRCVCLPFLRWVHRFGRPGGVPYPLRLWEKVRNYVIGHKELGIGLEGIRGHFVDEKTLPGGPDGSGRALMSESDWAYLIEDPIGHKEPKAGGGCGGCGHAVPKEATLETLYNQAKNTPSDINQHVAKLRELAAQCESVVEFGHRRGVSTVGLLAGQPKRLTSYDLREDPIWKALKERQGTCEFAFIQTDVTQTEIDECDLLFEDSRHTDAHISAILHRHSPKVRRWLAFHDTQIFGERGEDGGPGILPAIRRFMREHPEWSVIHHSTENHGFTILGRRPEDKPPLPPLPRMAWNYAKAIARHVASGAKHADEATIEARLDACATCEQRTENRCAVCGCYLDVGPNDRDGKAVWVESDCSLGKWPR